MMRRMKYCILFLLFFTCAGCAATSSSVKGPAGESREEVISAMEKVVGAVSGQEVSEKDLRELGKRAQTDPQTKSALEAVSGSVSGQAGGVKYCPVDGERYSAKFLECPVHHVPLKALTD